MTARPTRLGRQLSLLAAGVATLTLALAGWAVAVGAVGFLATWLGLRRGARAPLGLGAAGLLAGVLVAGLEAAPPSTLLVAAAGAVLAWDVGEHAIGLAEQLGPDAETRRAELAHALASTGVAAVSVLGGYIVFRVSTGGQPLLALFLFLLGALVLLSTLRG